MYIYIPVYISRTHVNKAMRRILQLNLYSFLPPAIYSSGFLSLLVYILCTCMYVWFFFNPVIFQCLIKTNLNMYWILEIISIFYLKKGKCCVFFTSDIISHFLTTADTCKFHVNIKGKLIL